MQCPLVPLPMLHISFRLCTYASLVFLPPLPTSLSSIPSSLIKKRTTLKKIVEWEEPIEAQLSLHYPWTTCLIMLLH